MENGKLFFSGEPIPLLWRGAPKGRGGLNIADIKISYLRYNNHKIKIRKKDDYPKHRFDVRKSSPIAAGQGKSFRKR